MPTSKRADFAMEAAELTAQMESIKRETAEFRQAQLLGDADLSRTRADLVAQLEALDGKIGSLLEQRNSRRESASSTSSYGSIFATWLAVVGSVVVGMLIAHDYLAERYTAFYQGRTIDIGAHPGYDAIFWAASLVAVVATTVAAIVAAYSGSSSRSSIKTSSSRRAASASSADSTAVSEYVFVDTMATTPTEVTPVVRV